MYKPYATLLILSVFFSVVLQARQPSFPRTSFSHFYFVLDSGAYKALLADKFCADTLFYMQAGSSKTDQGDWSGNYITGPVDYLEAFHPQSFPGADAGDIGWGEMLHRSQESKKLLQEWKTLANENIEVQHFTTGNGRDTIIVELLHYRDSMLLGGATSFFVLYYHPALLKKAGFTEEEISAGIDQEMINKRWYAGKPASRLYQKTKAVHLRLTPGEYERHRIALQAMGYNETAKQTFKKDVEIIISLDDKPGSRLQKIEFSLAATTEPRTIVLSPDAYIRLNGDRGELVVKQ
ncbi:MAG TPA: DUF5829 family protein [Chitinophagaceae bacterium]|nr:DUF5829 family protein [Chitinophagaceae bacterium]